MKIVVINGTEVRGCTYHIKETFLSIIRENNELVEYYLPRDLNSFCSGCKTCFFKDENKCPHAKEVMPIWESILEADLLVFAYPIYALRAPAAIKSLLDHLCVHWMVHRPMEEMFSKRAVILTQAIGMFYKAGLKDVKTSLSWLGVSDVKSLGVGLLEGVKWNELSFKRQSKIESKIIKLAKKYKKNKKVKKRLIVKIKFYICKKMHQKFANKEETISADNLHYLNKGWIKIK